MVSEIRRRSRLRVRIVWSLFCLIRIYPPTPTFHTTGDSGGPLVIREGSDKYILLATVSYGTPDCDGTPAGVYTTVGNQFEWIKSVVCTGGARDPSFCGPAPTTSPTSAPTFTPTSTPTSTPTTSPTQRPPPLLVGTVGTVGTVGAVGAVETEAEDDTRNVISSKVKALCVRESLRMYARRGRRNGRPAVKESCTDLSLRSDKSRIKTCNKKKAARRRCPQTCKGQCS